MMDMKTTLPSLLLALLLLPGPAGAGPPSCEDARHRLVAALDASGGALDAPVLDAFQAALGACPADDAAPLGHPDEREIPADFRGLHAAMCGYTELVRGGKPDADLTMWITYGSAYTRTEHAHAQATATYNPGTGLVAYDSRGPDFGLHARNDGTGAIYLDGLTIPVLRDATAEAGCVPPASRLCWGTGYAKATVPGVLTVSVMGMFNDCQT